MKICYITIFLGSILLVYFRKCNPVTTDVEYVGIVTY